MHRDRVGTEVALRRRRHAVELLRLSLASSRLLATQQNNRFAHRKSRCFDHDSFLLEWIAEVLRSCSEFAAYCTRFFVAVVIPAVMSPIPSTKWEVGEEEPNQRC